MFQKVADNLDIAMLVSVAFCLGLFLSSVFLDIDADGQNDFVVWYLGDQSLGRSDQVVIAEVGSD